MPSFRDLLKEFAVGDATPNESVRLFRKGLGMTLKEVEEVTGIREPHLSAIENGKIGMTQHYAEVFAVAFGIHPTTLLYPKGEFKKSKELSVIERRAKKYIERAHSEIKERKKPKAS